MCHRSKTVNRFAWLEQRTGLMKEGRGNLVSGKLEPQVSGVNHLPQEEWFSTGGGLASPDIWQCPETFLLVITGRQELLTPSG